MYKCQGIPMGLVALQNPHGGTEERFWSNWTKVNDPTAHMDMFTKCNELDKFHPWNLGTGFSYTFHGRLSTRTSSLVCLRRH